MRRIIPSTCIRYSRLYAAAIVFCALFVAGCTHTDPLKDPESPESLYVQARSIEDRAAASPQDAQTNLQMARETYEQALAKKPSKALEAYIRAAIANDSYFMDDYPQAIEQWSTAYPNLTDPDTKAWALYRIGLSQQRLGRFEQADKTFKQVQDRYPNSVPAQRSKEKQGVRQFYVQAATFTDGKIASTAIASARKMGLSGKLVADTQGRQVMQLGPVGTYTEARLIKNRIAGEYPDAMIIP